MKENTQSLILSNKCFTISLGGNIMSLISFRVDKEEKEMIESIAKFHGIGISSFIKKILFEKLEDDFDMEIIKEYQREVAQGKMEYYDYDEFWARQGL